MSSYVLLNTYDNFSINKLEINHSKLHYDNKPLFMITPKFTVKQIYDCDGHQLLHVNFNDTPQFRKFSEAVRQSEFYWRLQESNQNEEDDSLNHLLSNSYPTFFQNMISLKPTMFTLRIPLVNGKPQTLVFDQDELSVHPNIIDLGFNGRAIIQLQGFSKQGHVKWWIQQIKINVPPVYFNECVLLDDEKELK